MSNTLGGRGRVDTNSGSRESQDTSSSWSSVSGIRAGWKEGQSGRDGDGTSVVYGRDCMSWPLLPGSSMTFGDRYASSSGAAARSALASAPQNGQWVLQQEAALMPGLVLELGKEKRSMCLHFHVPQSREHSQNSPEKPHPRIHPRTSSLMEVQQMGGLRQELGPGQGVFLIFSHASPP